MTVTPTVTDRNTKILNTFNLIIPTVIPTVIVTETPKNLIKSSLQSNIFCISFVFHLYLLRCSLLVEVYNGNSNSDSNDSNGGQNGFPKKNK